MRRVLIALVLLSAACQHIDHAPYAGQDQRGLKSFSAEEIEAYLAGDGMGLAKVAELNGYPGPKHILELADQLDLTPAQRESVTASFDRMHTEAVRLGSEIIEAEKSLDALFGSAQPQAAEVSGRLVEIGTLEGRLRHAHIAAHLEMRSLLTPEQIAVYQELRGYGGHQGH